MNGSPLPLRARLSRAALLAGLFTTGMSGRALAASEISVDASDIRNSTTPWMYGSCIEDVNHEIYGGLYGQRLYGESFEEPAPQVGISGWTAWQGAWVPDGAGLSVGAIAGGKLVRNGLDIADGAMEFELRFPTAGPGGNNAGAIIHVKNAGNGADAFDGYEISLAADGRSIVLGRHQQNFASLQTAAVTVDPTQWQHLRVEIARARIRVYLNHSTTASIDYTDAASLPSGSMGVRTWNSAASFRNVRFISGAQPAVDQTFAAAPSAIAGWDMYGGQWAPAGTSVAADANLGAKLVRRDPEFLDGTVEFDLRFAQAGAAGNNAGAIVRVKNAGIGPDVFDGYEISLAANGGSIVLGRHQQNFASLRTAAIAVDPTQWQHLKVFLSGPRIQVFLNDNATAVIDYTDANPLPAGKMGLRDWGASAEFRNFRTVSGGQQVDATFDGVNAGAISGQWDAVATGTAQVAYALDNSQPFNGTVSQKVVFSSGSGTAGVANRGLNRWGVAVKSGTTYNGRIYLRGDAVPVTVSLQSLDGSKVYASQALGPVGSQWGKFPFTLTANGTDTNARFVVSYAAPGTLWIDQAVLMEPATGRFKDLPVRGDIADAMVAGKLTFLRYGGTAVNVPEYRWKKMIGDPDKRPPYLGNWHPHTSNGFGIEEFVAFCEAANITPAFAINVEETPQDMMDMVEYLNGSETSHWGAIRAANGHPKPYGVKYIELGNEEVIWGDIAADYDHYIERAKLLAAAMKQVDPSLVLINAAWWRGDNPNCKRVLQQLDGITDYWDFHFWADDANSGTATDRDLTQARQLFQQWLPGAKMKVVIFEENGNTHNLQRALGHATTLNAVRRHGDFVKIDCEANGLQPWLQNDNDWDQGHVFFTPSQVWGAPPYHAQQMASENHLPTIIGSSVIGGLDVTASKSVDGKTLCLSVVNVGAVPLDTRIVLSHFAGLDSTAKVWTLSGSTLAATNTPEQPEAVKPVTSQIGNASPDFRYTFPGYSYTILRFTNPQGVAAADAARDYALSFGLTGDAALPTADPDGDLVDNEMEWAFGTDPTRPDAAAGRTALEFADPAKGGFRFAHRRLSDAGRTGGFAYDYEVSSDLKIWHGITPQLLSATSLGDSPGYELAELQVPAAEVAAQPSLFLRVGRPHD